MPSADYAHYERSLSQAYRYLEAALVALSHGRNEGASEDIVEMQLELRRLMDDALRAQYPGRGVRTT
jgi:hypothetical protein